MSGSIDLLEEIRDFILNQDEENRALKARNSHLECENADLKSQLDVKEGAS